MILLFYILLLLLALTLSPVSCQQEPPVSVNTSLGRIIGLTTKNNTVDSFLGIQYALVKKRFQPSILVNEPWQTPLNATSFGSTCWQAAPPGARPAMVEAIHNDMPPQDEDCLFLNIWRPHHVIESTTLLPVMVYIHGGGFMFGSGSEPAYHGAMVAAKHDVLVVTLNYRLGMFGFLTQGTSGTGGLNGIHDQILAIKWIHNHIASFGGDPDNVTIFGESAGSISVCMLNVSPLAKGLFRRSIQQSGECALGILSPNTPTVGSQNTQLILSLLNATSVQDLANATCYPADMIAPYSSTELITWPTVDGWVLPKQPRELYTESTNNIVPTDMIIGSNTYDSPYPFVATPTQ